jgi:hypothetical protein
MSLRSAIERTLRSKRFWTWELGGAILYSIPAAIRFATKSSYIPILSIPGFWVWHFIPGNLVEKFLINAFFPGGAGGVAGEIFASNYRGYVVKGKAKYLARLGGALAQTAVWSAFQVWGYLQWVVGPYGGNIFEAPYVLPFNFLLASLSIFTPDIVGFVKSKVERAYRKLKEKH